MLASATDDATSSVYNDGVSISHRILAVQVATACAWVMLATSAIGSLRLLPWLFVPDVPWSVTAPFAEAIGAKATETALLVGLPVGCVLGAVRLKRTDRARVGMVNRALVPLVFSAILFGVGATWRADATQPGRVAIGLLKQTRHGCRNALVPKGAAVPMVGMTWLCFPGHEPRVVGMLPGSGGAAWFSARSLVAEPDLSGFELEEFRLATTTPPPLRSARLVVQHAQVRGLPPWGRPAKLPATHRSLLLALSAFLVGLIGIELVARVRISSPFAGLLVGGSSALLLLTTLTMLDEGLAAPSSYWLLLALAVAAPIAAGLIVDQVSTALRRTRFAGGSAE